MAPKKMLRSIFIIACLIIAVTATAVSSGECPRRLKRGYDSSYDSGYQAVTSQKEWKITAAGTNYDTRPASDVASQSLPDILQGSDKVFTQTGVGAKLITSFTVTDLETIVTPTGDATLQAAIIEQVYTETVSVREATATTATTSPTSSPLPSWATSASPPPGTFTITGINAQVISSTTVGLEAMAAATKAAGIQLWPSDTIASPYPANDNHAQSEYAAAPFASPSQDPNAGRAQAEKSESQVAEIPGHKLSVLPIGLGVLGFLTVLALTVVGYTTYERRKYREQFKRRKAAEANGQHNNAS